MLLPFFILKMCIRDSIWATLWKPALATLGLPYKEGLDAAARGSAGDSMRAVLRRFYGPDCDTDACLLYTSDSLWVSDAPTPLSGFTTTG